MDQERPDQASSISSQCSHMGTFNSRGNDVWKHMEKVLDQALMFNVLLKVSSTGKQCPQDGPQLLRLPRAKQAFPASHILG